MTSKERFFFLKEKLCNSMHIGMKKSMKLFDQFFSEAVDISQVLNL